MRSRGNCCGFAIALVLALTLSAPAQTLQVSFAAQNDEVVKKITGGIPSLKGIKIYQVSLCNLNNDTRSVHSGSVYIAAQKAKIATVGPTAAAFMLTRVERIHPLVLALNVAQWGSWAVALLAGADTVSLASNVKALLPLLGPAFKAAADKLQGVQPDFGPFAKAMLDGQMALPPSVCEERLLFATSGPDDPVFAEIPAALASTQPAAPPAVAPAAPPATPPPPGGTQ